MLLIMFIAVRGKRRSEREEAYRLIIYNELLETIKVLNVLLAPRATLIAALLLISLNLCKHLFLKLRHKFLEVHYQGAEH